MNTASNKALKTLVGNVFAQQVIAGKVQRAVMVRISNAVAIEDSIKALNSAEGK